jgi:hypothetical protein
LHNLATEQINYDRKLQPESSVHPSVFQWTERPSRCGQNIMKYHIAFTTFGHEIHDGSPRNPQCFPGVSRRNIRNEDVEISCGYTYIRDGFFMMYHCVSATLCPEYLRGYL